MHALPACLLTDVINCFRRRYVHFLMLHTSGQAGAVSRAVPMVQAFQAGERGFQEERPCSRTLHPVFKGPCQGPWLIAYMFKRVAWGIPSKNTGSLTRPASRVGALTSADPGTANAANV